MTKITMKENTPTEMRITRSFPDTNWHQVWKNLHTSATPDAITSTWYMAIHDLTPTNSRLADIHVSDTTSCALCGQLDTLAHRIADCGEGLIIWTKTQQFLGHILRTDGRRIPKEWTLRPDFCQWAPQRQTAVLWILAHFVHYRLNTQRRLSLQDYMDFLWRARWKSYRRAHRPRPTGNYLEVIDWITP
jgi:hypothetical protein